MGQVEHEQAVVQATSTAVARRLHVVHSRDADVSVQDDHERLEAKLDYDELARALLRHVLRCLQTS